MMTDFIDRLCESLRALHAEGTNVLLAVSGGADSVALLRGVAELQTKLELQVVVAHLNHQLRGAESGADEQFVAELCERQQVPVLLGRENILQIAENERTGVEETARRVRYQFLKESAAKAGARFVATAHTADDQAETILHHLLRGTGLAGMRGIARERELSADLQLIRPLLFATRAEIEAYLASIRQDFRSDTTNSDTTYTRNRIRSSLLPLLERDYNPQVRDALLRLGEQAGDLQDAVEQLAARFVEQATEQRDESTSRLNADVLRDLPRHLLRECFSHLWKEMNWPRQRMGFAEWDRLAGLALNGGAANLPGNIDVRARGRLIVLSKGERT